MTKPYKPRQGGSYTRPSKDAAPRLVEQTQQSDGPTQATAAANAEPASTPAEAPSKSKGK